MDQTSRVILVTSSLFILLGLTIILADSNILYEKIYTIEEVEKIAVKERLKLKIPESMKITIIMRDKLDNDYLGYVDPPKVVGGNYFIYLSNPTHISTIRHELYHVHRFYRLYPRLGDPEWQKSIGSGTGLKIVLIEQSLAYFYGWFNINLEL